jgi:hypothetical protein
MVPFCHHTTRREEMAQFWADDYQTYKVGTKVNALAYPGNDVIGTIVAIEGHLVYIQPDNKKLDFFWTPLCLCTPIKGEK